MNKIIAGILMLGFVAITFTAAEAKEDITKNKDWKDGVCRLVRISLYNHINAQGKEPPVGLESKLRMSSDRAEKVNNIARQYCTSDKGFDNCMLKALSTVDYYFMRGMSYGSELVNAINPQLPSVQRQLFLETQVMSYCPAPK